MKTKTIFLIPLMIGLIFWSCSKKTPIPVPPPAAVEVATSIQKNIPKFIDTLGHFVAYNSVTIQAQVQGELTGIYFTEGQEVKAHDLLFTIDPKPYQAVLDKSVATLRQNEALYAYAQNRVERYTPLVSDDFVSKLDYQQYVSDMDSYAAVIEENLAEIETAEINLGYCTLSSPIQGITGKKLIDVGNIITDVGSKLLVINQVSPLYIDFSIPERYFDSVYQHQQKQNLEIQIFVPNTPLKTSAYLQMLDNSINPNTGMIGLRGVLPNLDKRFWPEQFVRVRLIIDTIENAVLVPPSAVVPTAQGEVVWVVENNKVHTQLVELGEQYENMVQITKGLKAGQMVVTKGQLGLSDNREVAFKTKEEKKS